MLRLFFYGLTVFILWGALPSLMGQAAPKKAPVMEDEGEVMDSADDSEFSDLEPDDSSMSGPPLRMGRGGIREDDNFQEPLPDMPDEDDQPPAALVRKPKGAQGHDKQKSDKKPHSALKKKAPKEPMLPDNSSDDMNEEMLEDRTEDDSPQSADDEEPAGRSKKRTRDKETMTSPFDWNNIDLHSLIAKKDY